MTAVKEEVVKETTNKKRAGRPKLSESEKAQRKALREAKKETKPTVEEKVVSTVQEEILPQLNVQPQPQQTLHFKPQPVQQPPLKVKLPSSIFNYRYIINTGRFGAVYLNDLNKLIDFDSRFQAVVKISKSDYERSSDLAASISRQELIDVTDEYIQFLENGYQSEQFLEYYRFNQQIQQPQFKAAMRGDYATDSPILSENDLSRVPETSDWMQHMQRITNPYREGFQPVAGMEPVLDYADAHNSPIADESIVDRSNHNTFVDRRMYMTKQNTPRRPQGTRMRTDEFSILPPQMQQQMLHPQALTHHDQTMIDTQNQVYAHLPQGIQRQPGEQAFPGQFQQAAWLPPNMKNQGPQANPAKSAQLNAMMGHPVPVAPQQQQQSLTGNPNGPRQSANAQALLNNNNG